ncbi:dipeptidase [Glacieibacterium sp.]|uniref:dipeptidase n=1 Tax=Glacieibacterium sp. TaxID=2860237 RepID=UPI003B00AAAC
MIIDRRTLFGLAGATLAAHAATGKAAHAATVKAASAARADPVVINALGALDDPNHPLDEDDRGPLVITPRMIADAHASGETAVNITLGYVAGSGDPFESSVGAIGRWDRALRAHPRDLLKVLGTDDILRAGASRKIGIIYGFQNAAMMGSDASRVDIFADLGVRVVQLTYNAANQLGDGSMVPAGRGLSKFGHEVVERLNANRIMVDLSHSGRQICLDAIRASRQPISINHTGCRAVTDLPRNKTDEELRLVARSGGFVGIYFMPFLAASGHATAADVVAHIEHALNVCGEDHVGIGTDGGTTAIDDLEAYKSALAKEHADRVAKGIAATGERADTHPFVDDLRGRGQFRKLGSLLAARGHKSTTIEKVLGTNFLRYAREIWG